MPRSPAVTAIRKMVPVIAGGTNEMEVRVAKAAGVAEAARGRMHTRRWDPTPTPPVSLWIHFN